MPVWRLEVIKVYKTKALLLYLPVLRTVLNTFLHSALEHFLELPKRLNMEKY